MANTLIDLFRQAKQTITAAATASSIMFRDTNANTRANTFACGVATTATAAGTTTLTVASAELQQFTGTSTQNVVLPDATTLPAGHPFIIANRSTGAVTVKTNGGATLATVPAGAQVTVRTMAVDTAAGTWDVTSVGGGGLATSNFVIRETPAGSVNGSNATFTLANTPVAGTEDAYLNGMLLEPGSGNDYTISGATITMLTVPVSGDKLRVSYLK